MSTDSEHNTDLLFGVIPSSELEPHQIATTENGNELPTFTFLRAPFTINELVQYSHGAVVWMEKNETLVLLNFHDIIALESYGPKVQYTKYVQMGFAFDDRTHIIFRIFGKLNAILETAAFLARLKVSDERNIENITITYGRGLRFDDSHSEQFASLFEAISATKLNFLMTKLNHDVVAVLATRPYPMNVTFLCATFDLDDFIFYLEDRTTLFGSLSLGCLEFEDSILRQLFQRLDLFENLDVGELPSDLVSKLLSAPMKSIGFAIPRDTEGMDLSTTEIVAKDIDIGARYDTFPTSFMVSFLHRLAQLGHLESLTISRSGRLPAPVDFERALLHAVEASKELRHLELSSSQHVWGSFIEDLFRVMEKHEALRTFRIYPYPAELDPHCSWLKQLLRRNRSIESTDVSEDDWEVDDEVDRIHALNRFFRGLKRLNKEPTPTRPLLVCAALTQSATCDFRRTGLLLSDHTDLFCELLREALPAFEAEDVMMEADLEDSDHSSVSASEASVESSEGLNRKRKNDEGQ